MKVTNLNFVCGNLSAQGTLVLKVHQKMVFTLNRAFVRLYIVESLLLIINYLKLLVAGDPIAV